MKKEIRQQGISVGSDVYFQLIIVAIHFIFIYANFISTPQLAFSPSSTTETLQFNFVLPSLATVSATISTCSNAKLRIYLNYLYLAGSYILPKCLFRASSEPTPDFKFTFNQATINIIHSNLILPFKSASVVRPFLYKTLSHILTNK